MGQRDIGLGDIILGAVLQGFRSSQDFDTARRALLCFPVFPLVGTELARQSAANYRTLRRRGISVRKTIDCLIATFVIAHGYALLHSDRNFAPFEHHLGLWMWSGPSLPGDAWPHPVTGDLRCRGRQGLGQGASSP